MIWDIDFTESASRQLSKLDRQSAARITAYLRARVSPLDDPRSLGHRLVGPLAGYWRYRVGDYRIICDIQDKRVRVLVVRIGHRREVYD